MIESETEIAFGRWLGAKLPSLNVDIQISKSKYVISGMKKRYLGIEAITHAYVWKSRWFKFDELPVDSSDWASTKKSLARLTVWLKEATCEINGSEKHALEACLAVVAWGGGKPTAANGAPSFLRGLAETGELRTYLRAAAKSLSLSSPSSMNTEVRAMNSMLTKVHALIADDGLPIYDTRVAAAAACLAEIYRVEMLTSSRLPAQLHFPAVGWSKIDGRRRVGRMSQEAPDPGVLLYGGKSTTPRWCAAKLRLGRVLTTTVVANPALFAEEGSPSARIRAIEAGLFMIGYDVACLKDVAMAGVQR